MHGRKRTEYKAMMRDPKVSASLGAKAQKWHVLMATLQERRAAYTADSAGAATTPEDRAATLALTEKAVLVNPDPVWLWNVRRELLLKQDDTWKLNDELQLTQGCLQQGNPKAYGAWFHRKWCLTEKAKKSNDTEAEEVEPTETLLEHELALTKQFLQRDERNFHCWNYRRFAVALLLHSHGVSGAQDGSWPLEESPMGAQVGNQSTVAATTATDRPLSALPETVKRILKQEWEFTTSKVQDNFSNFSAFHYRSKLLPQLLLLLGESSSDWEMTRVMDQELSLVENAVFTEPDDQTAWWYQRFLLDLSVSSLAAWNKQQGVDASTSIAAKRESIRVRWEQHAEQLRELLEEVSTSKWVCLGLVQVLERLGQDDECQSLWKRLVNLDPDRKVRYQEQLKV